MPSRSSPRAKARPAVEGDGVHLVALVVEHFVVGLVPDVGTLTQPVEGNGVHLVIGQHTKRRDDVFLEVLILVVADDDHEIRIELVEFLSDGAKGLEYAGTMGLVGADALVVTPLQPHRLGPVVDVLHIFRDARVGMQHTSQRPRLVFFGHQPRRVVGRPDSQYLPYVSPPWCLSRPMSRETGLASLPHLAGPSGH